MVPAQPEAPSEPRKLTVRSAAPAQPQSPTETEEITVHKLLDDAYAPDRKKAQRAKRIELTFNIAFTLGLTVLAMVLTFGYAHFWNQWPVVEPMSWYAPFIISVAISLYLVIKAVHILKNDRRFSMLITGGLLAGILSFLNIATLDVTAQAEHYAPDNCLWEAEGTLEMLLAYEINACRGWGKSSNAYNSISIQQYKDTFRALPREQWKPYFRKHLTAQELEQTNSINIDERMRLVAARMHVKRVNTWNEFDALYQEQPIPLRIKRWLIFPYTAAFKQL